MSEAEIKLTRGVPAPESFPTAQLAECAKAALEKNPTGVLQYGGAGGYAPLRAYLAGQVGVAENRVLIGQGSLQLLDFLARIHLQPGSLAYVEEPSYDRAVTTLRRNGATVRGIPLAADGIDIDLLEARLRQGERPVLFYVIPDFQNPSGAVLSLEKRRRLAALAQEYGFWLVEDIPYRRLRYRGEDVPTLFDLAPEQVVQMSSFSKLISPGLRVGYAVLPQAINGSLLKFVEDTYICPSFMVQGMVFEFIQRGWLDSNLAKLKALYAPRLDAMLAALDAHMHGQATWLRPQGGFFIGMTLKKPVIVENLLAQAKSQGLALTDGRGFFANGGGDTFIRLPFCALTASDIETGITRLAQVIHSLS